MRFISPWPRSLWLACLCVAGAAWAQSAPVSSQLQVEQVETLDGKTVLHSVQASKPGDVLEYRVSYTNHSAAAVQGLIASLPIPAGTTLVDGSQLPPDALARGEGDADSYSATADRICQLGAGRLLRRAFQHAPVEILVLLDDLRRAESLHGNGPGALPHLAQSIVVAQ